MWLPALGVVLLETSVKVVVVEILRGAFFLRENRCRFGVLFEVLHVVGGVAALERG